MNTGQLAGIARGIVMVLSGIGAAVGYLKGVDWVGIAGGLTAILGFVSSIRSNGIKSVLTQAANAPEVHEIVVDQHVADQVPSAKVVPLS